MTHKVLLIGDSCIDEYKIGVCDRLSPEAPVPVIKVVESYKVPGMAANVYNNLSTLGLNVGFITNKEEIIKTRYVDKRSGQHMLRVDQEPPIQAWKGISAKAIKNFDAIIISDYNKGFISYEHIESLIRKFSGPIFIDTKKTNLKRFDGCIIKINSLEYSLAKSTNIDHLIVTKGAEGAEYQGRLYPAHRVEVTDVCGAGDTFLAALVYKYLADNRNVPAAIEFANKASAITVTKNGVYAPTLIEIMRV